MGNRTGPLIKLRKEGCIYEAVVADVVQAGAQGCGAMSHLPRCWSISPSAAADWEGRSLSRRWPDRSSRRRCGKGAFPSARGIHPRSAFRRDAWEDTPRSGSLPLLKACCETSIVTPDPLVCLHSLCSFRLVDSRPTSSIVRSVERKFNLRSRVNERGKAASLELASSFGSLRAARKRRDQERRNGFMDDLSYIIMISLLYNKRKKRS